MGPGGKHIFLFLKFENNAIINNRGIALIFVPFTYIWLKNYFAFPSQFVLDSDNKVPFFSV